MLRAKTLLVLSIGFLSSAVWGQELRDPTRPAAAQGTVTTIVQSQLELQAVTLRDDRRTAVINQQRVRVGDHIGGYQVTAIQFDSVLLQNANEQRELRMFETVKVTTRERN